VLSRALSSLKLRLGLHLGLDLGLESLDLVLEFYVQDDQLREGHRMQVAEAAGELRALGIQLLLHVVDLLLEVGYRRLRY